MSLIRSDLRAPARGSAGEVELKLKLERRAEQAQPYRRRPPTCSHHLRTASVLRLSAAMAALQRPRQLERQDDDHIRKGAGHAAAGGDLGSRVHARAASRLGAVARLAVTRRVNGLHSSAVSSVCHAEDGSTLCSTSVNQLRIFCPNRSRLLRASAAGELNVSSCIQLLGLDLVALGSLDSRLHIYSVGRARSRSSPHTMTPSHVRWPPPQPPPPPLHPPPHHSRLPPPPTACRGHRRPRAARSGTARCASGPAVDWPGTGASVLGEHDTRACAAPMPSDPRPLQAARRAATWRCGMRVSAAPRCNSTAQGRDHWLAWAARWRRRRRRRRWSRRYGP